MDYLFLPDKVKNTLQKEKEDAPPLAVVRSNGSLTGGSGEGYLVAYDDEIFLFSKNFGEVDFTIVKEKYSSDSLNMSMRKDSYSTLLNVALDQGRFTLKLSSFEAKDAEKILEIAQAAKERGEEPRQTPETPPEPPPSTAPPPLPGSTPPPPPPVPQPESQISPLAGLAAALMFVAACDEEIAQDEDDYIREICQNNESVLREGLEYYQDHSFEELIQTLSDFDHQQKLCILANMLELGMSDGVLHSVEQRLVAQFVEECGVNEEEHQTIRDVLLVKNQVSSLVP